MIGERIKQARTAAGLPQEALAQQAGVSTMAISKYERDAMKPGSEILLKMASALGVRTEYFFRQVELEITDPDFRKHKTLGATEQNRVIAQMREAVERWINLEQLTPTNWSTPFKLPKGLPTKVTDFEQVEAIAEHVRKKWELGAQPISDMADLLERKGIKVFMLEYDAGKRWDGLVAKANGQPVVVVGADWPGDRQRFTLAHELGHLILEDRLDGDLGSHDDEERACHRFAGAFIMPRAAVLSEFGAKRTRIEPLELMHAKKEWGLSMSAMIFRARDSGVLTQTNAGRMFGMFKKRGWMEKEPGEPFPRETADGFAQFVYRALGEERISESKAAELLQVSLKELRAERLVEDEAVNDDSSSDQ